MTSEERLLLETRIEALENILAALLKRVGLPEEPIMEWVDHAAFNETSTETAAQSNAVVEAINAVPSR